MKYIRGFFLFLLPFIARIHPKNWGVTRWEYPQLWYCMPRRWKKHKVHTGIVELRRAKPRLVIEHICEFLTGHELSKTELGYGKGFIDRNCRWCDKFIQVPVSENIVSPIFKNLMGMVDEEVFLIDED
jgi:hypothetical protein